jgi:elongation factor Ts
MMDCKKTLQEAEGDIEKAVELLRVKLGNKVGTLADRETTEGPVHRRPGARRRVARENP